ncbi:glycosyltransferase family 2 protein [Pelagibacterium montanilacus]|uniref:glycosyltransferase family 2 protein n=1 Tax=Pelagibacterium montanilacus TaxID=2185280 RepID=UPI000F8E8CB5|nr:glycosyltransferase [Pelagibacterium montanilacus]
MPEARIMVAIPTFRRPRGLTRLLASLALLEGGRDITIVIAENDPEGGAGRLAARAVCEAGYPHRVDVLDVPAPGIARARNALLDRFHETPTASHLAMLDDDQWVGPGWLEALLEMQTRTGADIVGGWTIPDFAGPVPAWSRGLELYWRRRRANGLCGPLTGAGGVLLARKSLARAQGLRFSDAFSATGGEDKAFFAALGAAGARFAFASDARTYETIPPERADRDWASRRAAGIGQVDTTLALAAGPRAAAEAVLRLPLGLAAGWAGLALSRGDGARAMKARLRLARAAGRLEGLRTAIARGHERAAR